MPNIRQEGLPYKSRLVFTLLLVLLLVGITKAKGEWEMRVCADPNGLPFSDRAGGGFENRIAEVLAAALGARVTYDWYPAGPEMITTRLREGECDLVMGVPDGYRELLTTVAYYQGRYAFVFRKDQPFDVTSLDDPILGELKIGIQSNDIPPHDALLARGLQDSVVRQYGQLQYAGGGEDASALVEDVISGKIDVGIGGPAVGYFARDHNSSLKVAPVTPEIEAAQNRILPMVFPITIGLRPGDEAFRDELDVAIVQNWPKIQEILGNFAVATGEASYPSLPQTASGDILKVGVVVPTTTGAAAVAASLYDLVGDAAQMGALSAEGEISNHPDRAQVSILLASSPSAAAAQRAGERLVTLGKVEAIVGGLGVDQTETLAHIATQRNVLFFNLGSSNPDLTRACESTVFHVEASAEMYTNALINWFSTRGHRRWFIVHENNAAGKALQAGAAEILRDVPGDEVAGSLAVDVEQATYANELNNISSSDADIVLLLLNARDQMVFMAEQDSILPGVAVAPFPDPVTQTRDYLAAARLRAGKAGMGPRVQLWETTLDGKDAGPLNERFIARWGEPMEPSAWAAYAAVQILSDATTLKKTHDPLALTHFLESPDATFELHKGAPIGFRASDHQLGQPLYVISVNSESPWGHQVSKRIQIADLLSVLPISDTSPPENQEKSTNKAFCRLQTQ